MKGRLLGPLCMYKGLDCIYEKLDIPLKPQISFRTALYDPKITKLSESNLGSKPGFSFTCIHVPLPQPRKVKQKDKSRLRSKAR